MADPNTPRTNAAWKDPTTGQDGFLEFVRQLERELADLRQKLEAEKVAHKQTSRQANEAIEQANKSCGDAERRLAEATIEGMRRAAEMCDEHADQIDATTSAYLTGCRNEALSCAEAIRAEADRLSAQTAAKPTEP